MGSTELLLSVPVDATAERDRLEQERTEVQLEFDRARKQLAGFKQLRRLNLSATEVTAAGVKELRKALPACKVIKPEVP